jgi:N-carbamoylputrescine amidase
MKIAAAYHHTEPGNISLNLRKTLDLLSQLEHERTDFVLFPELNLSGYLTSEKEIKEILKRKEEVFSPLKEFSRHSKTAFACGFPEERGGNFYITHFIFEKGEITGIHRKTHLGPNEKDVFCEGDKLPVFKVNKLTIGMQLCFETHFPEISYAQARQGANLLSLGFASPNESSTEKKERFKRFLCARAYDNACYVLACNLSGLTSRGAMLPGVALIIDPKGKVLAEETKHGNGYCIASYEKKRIDQIYQSKMAWFNRFKRNDILRQFYE